MKLIDLKAVNEIMGKLEITPYPDISLSGVVEGEVYAFIEPALVSIGQVYPEEFIRELVKVSNDFPGVVIRAPLFFSHPKLAGYYVYAWTMLPEQKEVIKKARVFDRIGLLRTELINADVANAKMMLSYITDGQVIFGSSIKEFIDEHKKILSRLRLIEGL